MDIMKASSAYVSRIINHRSLVGMRVLILDDFTTVIHPSPHVESCRGVNPAEPNNQVDRGCFRAPHNPPDHPPLLSNH